MKVSGPFPLWPPTPALLVVLGAVVLLGGCGPTSLEWAAPGDEAAPREEGLIGGAETFELPAVGLLGPHLGCTASLISPRVVLTNAHCIGQRQDDYLTIPLAGVGEFTFSVTSDDGTRQSSFRGGPYRIWGRLLGANDLALVFLLDPVPHEVARPLELARAHPAAGATMTVYGYGCTDRSSGAGVFIKRKLVYAHPTSSVGCPGDSGGPRLVDGRIAYLTSAYDRLTGEDANANVVDRAGELEAQVQLWEEQVARCTGARSRSACRAASPDCSWSDCTRTCAPALLGGKPLISECPVAVCNAQPDVARCDATLGCAWYAANTSSPGACWPRGTPEAVGLSTPASVLSLQAKRRLCGNLCFVKAGQATDDWSNADGCAANLEYLRGTDGQTCWKCNAAEATAAGSRRSEPEKGWVGGNLSASCGLELDCPSGCYVDFLGAATDRTRGGHCALPGEYWRGTDGQTCWRCSLPTRAGARQTRPDLPGGGWNGGATVSTCDASQNP